MTKRKCEQQLLLSPLPPCKKAQWEPPLQPATRCSSDSAHVTPGKKRKLDPECGALVEAIIPSPECEKTLSPAAATSPPPCKKLRVAGPREHRAPLYQCQKDEAFSEYNSFQYWRTPLPDIDFSEIAVEPCEAATNDSCSVTDVLEEMDS